MPQSGDVVVRTTRAALQGDWDWKPRIVRAAIDPGDSSENVAFGLRARTRGNPMSRAWTQKASALAVETAASLNGSFEASEEFSFWKLACFPLGESTK